MWKEDVWPNQGTALVHVFAWRN